MPAYASRRASSESVGGTKGGIRKLPKKVHTFTSLLATTHLWMDKWCSSWKFDACNWTTSEYRGCESDQSQSLQHWWWHACQDTGSWKQLARFPESKSSSVLSLSSAKNFVKSDRPAVRQEFIFVKHRSSLVALRSFGRCFVAYRLSSHPWIFLMPHLWFCEKFSQEFNLVKKSLWRKWQN